MKEVQLVSVENDEDEDETGIRARIATLGQALVKGTSAYDEEDLEKEEHKKKRKKKTNKSFSLTKAQIQATHGNTEGKIMLRHDAYLHMDHADFKKAKEEGRVLDAPED